MPDEVSPQADAARRGQFASSYLVHAAYAQLLGLCRGLLADGDLVDSEIVALHDWLEQYADLLPEWPAQLLARRVRDVLSDGLVEPRERTDLAEFIERAAGREGTDRFDAPTSLPLDRPPPHIEYEKRAFCLTGTFVFGPRKRVSGSIEEWGGRVIGTPKKADYLIIGGTITPAWKFGSHGLKIEEAVRLRASGSQLKIVSESHWVTSLC